MCPSCCLRGTLGGCTLAPDETVRPSDCYDGCTCQHAGQLLIDVPARARPVTAPP